MLSVDKLQMELLNDDSCIGLSTFISFFLLFAECVMSAETESALFPTLFRFAFLQSHAFFIIVLYNAVDNLKRKWKACVQTTRDPCTIEL